jgi:acyl dehydratase
VDVARASQSGFGGTIAHGYLTLALIPLLWHSRFDVREIDAAINVGFDRVRFAAPLLVGTRIRARFAVLETTHAPHGLRTVTRATIEAERVEKPVCIADLIVLYRAAA